MAADEIILEQICVNKELYCLFLVIQKPKHTHRARGDVKMLFHMLRTAEAQACRAKATLS